MNTYFFIFGNTPQLSFAELKSILTDQEIKPVFDNMVAVELENDDKATQLMDILGGTVKILKLEQEFTEKLDEDQTHQAVTELLSSLAEKPTFAFTHHGDKTIDISDISIKKYLRKQGIKSRFLESGKGLSASVLLHQKKVIEIYLIETENISYLAKTVGIQNIDQWTVRDRGKPYFNRKKGMLPPKVARMMVNLAISEKSEVRSEERKRQITIYDPFCGTGTILIEAMVRGYDVIGSDLDIESVYGSETNLIWFKGEYRLDNFYKIFKKDVSQVTSNDTSKKVDAIVTEPFLGKQTPDLNKVPNIFKGLEKLYLGAFKTWTKILNKGAKVVIIFPLIEAGHQRYDFHKLIDKLVDFDYTLEIEPIVYARKGAVVKRQICVFKWH